MSGVDPPTSESAGRDDPALLARAKEIFTAVRELGLADRQEALDRACAGDAGLYELVWSLLKGDQAPLAFESLADDIRAAHATAGGTPLPLGLNASSSGGGSGDGGGGDRIGNYRLLERIGEGGFGVVYAAEQERPVRRRVALKIIKLGMDTRQVVARFEAERQALAMMDHPCIARVFDAGATQTGRPYFVMELVKGPPITQYCDQKKLGIRERLTLVAQVCDALQHAHQKGVIHRDIKPSNVLVTTIDDKPTPKIIDFGIAKATSARLTEKTLFTEARQIVGTPEYMSPEQADVSGGDIDTRSDVYSTGVLMYELLTGAPPFDSSRLRSAAYAELQRIIREEDPPSPSIKLRNSVQTLASVASTRSIAPERLSTLVRGELDWIVMKAMEKDRARRYDSAGAMARDIERYLRGEAIQAAPPSAAYLTKKFVLRHKGPVIAAALLLLALIAGLIGTSAGFIRANLQRQRADANAAEARAAEAIATRSAYSANMLSASNALASVEPASARAFLQAAPESLRGWEWRTLNARLDTSVRTLATDALSVQPFDEILFFDLILARDGRSFFAVQATGDPTASRWDLATGNLLQSFVWPFGHTALEFPFAALSPDGRRLTFVPYLLLDRKELRTAQWDLESRKQISTPSVPIELSPATRVAAVGDGSRIIVYSDSVATLRSIDSGDALAQQPIEGLPHWLPMSSVDGTLVLEPGPINNPNIAIVRDARSLKVVAELRGHAGMVMATVISDDNRWVGTASDDGTARVWDLKASPPTSIILPHGARVSNIRFSPDASRVATIAKNRAIRVWDRASGRLEGTFVGESLIPRPLMFLQDGKTVAGRETNGAVRFWDADAEATTALRGFTLIASGVRHARANPADIVVASSWDGADASPGAARAIARFWDADSGDEVARLAGRPGDIVRSMDVSDDGQFVTLQIVHRDEQLRVINTGTGSGAEIGRTDVLSLTTGERVFSIPTDRTPYWTGFSRHGGMIIIDNVSTPSGDRYQAHCLDQRTGSILRTIDLQPDPSDGAYYSARSNDATLIAAIATVRADAHGQPTCVVHILDAKTLDTVRTLKGLVAAQMSIAFSPDNRRILTGGEDGQIHIYDAQSGQPLATLPGHASAVLALSFSPDGSRLASASLDRTIRIWNTNTNDPVAALAGHQGHINTLEWQTLPPTPDRPKGDYRLFSSSGDSTVRIWEPAPIRTRVQARDARRASLARVEPIVESLFQSLRDPAKVIDRIKADQSLSPLDQKTALQLVLAKGLATQPTSQAAAAP